MFVTFSPFPRPPRGWGGLKDRTRARYCHFRVVTSLPVGKKRLKPTRIYGYDVTSGRHGWCGITRISLLSSVSTPQLVASTLASTSSVLPSHLYASSLLASPIFLAKVASPSLAPALSAMAVPVQRQAVPVQRQAVPVQRQPGPTSTFQSGNFPQTPLVPAPSMGPYVGSSSNLPPVPQWPATTPGFQPHSASFPPSLSTLCHSWNAGRCSSQFLRCRFRHLCDFPGCSALHHRVVAHRKAANSPAPEPPFKRRRPSDA